MEDLPGEVVALAARLGVRDDRGRGEVRLSQIGTMRNDPAGTAMRFSATQSIRLDAPGFEWRARTGTLSCLTVIDALTGARPRSELLLLNVVRVAGAPSDARAMLKGQLLRYLAELPWAPDALLRNHSLHWHVRADGLTVALDDHGVACSVDFELDDNGRISAVSASDRPRLEGKRFVERPWQGRFFDYRRHCDCWLPFKGEVGWQIDGRLAIVWQGELTGRTAA